MVCAMGIPEEEKAMSVEEYLAGEPSSEIRHEFIGGEVYAMSGGSEAHNLISGNLLSAIRQHLRGKPCKVFMADMKVRLNIATDDIFYYPDVMVTCDPSDDAKFYKTKPCLIIEVLSPSTERVDRREKFLSYQRIPSLNEYILVDQETMEVTVFERVSDWNPRRLGNGQTLTLPSIDFNMPIAEVYEDVLEA